jgi:hypothetical protein
MQYWKTGSVSYASGSRPKFDGWSILVDFDATGPGSQIVWAGHHIDDVADSRIETTLWDPVEPGQVCVPCARYLCDAPLHSHFFI